MKSISQMISNISFVKHIKESTLSKHEIGLPTKAGWLDDDKIVVDVSEIRTLKTKFQFGHYLVLRMKDGRKVEVFYNDNEKCRTKDIDKIVKMQRKVVKRISNKVCLTFE